MWTSLVISCSCNSLVLSVSSLQQKKQPRFPKGLRLFLFLRTHLSRRCFTWPKQIAIQFVTRPQAYSFSFARAQLPQNEFLVDAVLGKKGFVCSSLDNVTFVDNKDLDGKTTSVSRIHSLTPSLPPSLPHSLTQLAHSTRSLARSLTRSLTHSINSLTAHLIIFTC